MRQMIKVIKKVTLEHLVSSNQFLHKLDAPTEEHEFVLVTRVKTGTIHNTYIL